MHLTIAFSNISPFAPFALPTARLWVVDRDLADPAQGAEGAEADAEHGKIGVAGSRLSHSESMVRKTSNDLPKTMSI